jgi:hypothetical protein
VRNAFDGLLHRVDVRVAAPRDREQPGRRDGRNSRIDDCQATPSVTTLDVPSASVARAVNCADWPIDGVVGTPTIVRLEGTADVGAAGVGDGSLQPTATLTASQSASRHTRVAGLLMRVS